MHFVTKGTQTYWEEAVKQYFEQQKRKAEVNKKSKKR